IFDMPQIQHVAQKTHVRLLPTMIVKMSFELPEARRPTAAIWRPRCEYRIFLFTIHQTGDVLDRCNAAPGRVERPPRLPKLVDIGTKHSVSCQRSNPTVGPRAHALIVETNLLVNFFKDCSSYEIDRSLSPLCRQILINHVAVGQNRI